MDYQLRGKTAYVSAGAHGIGEAIADLLTAEGALVVVADSDAAVLREKGSKWRGTAAADLSSAEGVGAAVAYVLDVFQGPPDILVNNLGVGNSTPFEETTDEIWERSLSVNLMGCVRTSRALVPLMAKRGSGAVVNTGSDLAKQPEPGFVDYGTCKAGLLYQTKALAKQYAPVVRVNSVLPGPTRSRGVGDFVDALAKDAGKSAAEMETEFFKTMRPTSLIKRFSTPDEVASLVAYVASPLSSSITGAPLRVDGGVARNAF